MFQKLIIYSSFSIVLMFFFSAVEGMEDKHSHHHRLENSKRSIASRLKARWKSEHSLVSPQIEVKMKSYLRSIKAHSEALKEVFEKAEERIIICSPDVSKKFVGEDFIDFIKACKKDVTITIFTSPIGGFVLEEVLNNHTLNISVEWKPMNHCGIYCLIMDSTLFANGAFPWLSPDEKASNVYLTSVIIGFEAQRSIDLCTHDLNKAFQKERDDSAAEIFYNTQKKALQEVAYPRPVTPAADPSNHRVNTSFFSKN